jgi:alkanesulfonate monooxygenase SsuD/methylene tetrahydromethanopterin reductase-like flavin-dependent oxidoreductase (luciferase family)
LSSRGFIASGALPLAELTELAAGAEQLGYAAFWTTVLAGHHDPAALIEAAAADTKSIPLGLGLVPLDAFPAAAVGRSLLAGPVPPERIVCALGVGLHRVGAAEFWRQGATAFRRTAPQIRLAVGSYGPRVLRAGGAVADAVLLNWMTPKRARWALERFAEGATGAGRDPSPPLYVIVNAGFEQAQLDSTLAEYAKAPYHRRHQEQVGDGEPLGIVVERPAGIGAQLDPWSWAMPLVNPIGAGSAAERRELQQLSAPSAG